MSVLRFTIVYFVWLPCVVAAFCHLPQQRQSRPAALLSSSDDDNAIEEEIDDLTDAEALLACRAYLSRKNRLQDGWSKAKYRKALAKEALEAGASIWNPPPVGYNSEDPEEEIDDRDPGEVLLVDVTSEQLPDNSNSQDGGIFTSLPDGPTERSEMRSLVKRAQWQDEEFRKRWYKSRWGSHVKKSSDVKRIEKTEMKLMSIAPEILESEEFASLTQDEIQEAIRTYISSNRKRVKARKETKEKEFEETEERPAQLLERDSLYNKFSEDALREKQLLRSEKSKKAYQTRLANAAKKKKKQQQSDAESTAPKGATPHAAAMLSVTNDLDANRMPSVTDVQTMMVPAKLGKRKELLKRILKQPFDKRGKCVPTDTGDESFVSITKASVAQLGSFVVALLLLEDQNERNAKS